MADPTEYQVSYSFSGFQANSPTTPLPAPKLDAELANISEAIDDHASAIKDVRRSDGALKDNIVTYDSLALALQLIFDPTDGQAVANAVAAAQAAATAASGSATAAGTSATNAAVSAAAAAASAGSVNLSLFLSKAGNLAGMGNNDTALANIGAAKIDGSTAVGRWSPHAGISVADFNSATLSGWYGADTGAANSPDTTQQWLFQVVSFSTFWNMQIAYPFVNALSGDTNTVTPIRRFSYTVDNVTTSWTPWASANTVAVGSVDWFAATAAPPGYVKLNGALLTRTAYPALWAHASASGNIVTEASWSGGNSGAFSTGDLSTTFRLPDARGEFIRAFDDGRGVDAGRTMGSKQADLLKDHTHNYGQGAAGPQKPNSGGTAPFDNNVTTPTSGVNSGLGGTETRPRNIPLLACIKY